MIAYAYNASTLFLDPILALISPHHPQKNDTEAKDLKILFSLRFIYFKCRRALSACTPAHQKKASDHTIGSCEPPCGC